MFPSREHLLAAADVASEILITRRQVELFFFFFLLLPPTQSIGPPRWKKLCGCYHHQCCNIEPSLFLLHIKKHFFCFFFSIILPLDGKNGINNARDWKEKKVSSSENFWERERGAWAATWGNEIYIKIASNEAPLTQGGGSAVMAASFPPLGRTVLVVIFSRRLYLEGQIARPPELYTLSRRTWLDHPQQRERERAVVPSAILASARSSAGKVGLWWRANCYCVGRGPVDRPAIDSAVVITGPQS